MALKRSRFDTARDLLSRYARDTKDETARRLIVQIDQNEFARVADVVQMCGVIPGLLDALVAEKIRINSPPRVVDVMDEVEWAAVSWERRNDLLLYCITKSTKLGTPIAPLLVRVVSSKQPEQLLERLFALLDPADAENELQLHLYASLFFPASVDWCREHPGDIAKTYATYHYSRMHPRVLSRIMWGKCAPIDFLHRLMKQHEFSRQEMIDYYFDRLLDYEEPDVADGLVWFFRGKQIAQFVMDHPFIYTVSKQSALNCFSQARNSSKIDGLGDAAEYIDDLGYAAAYLHRTRDIPILTDEDFLWRRIQVNQVAAYYRGHAMQMWRLKKEIRARFGDKYVPEEVDADDRREEKTVTY